MGKIENFNYNGKGPDAFFYVGESGSPSGSGTLVPYPEGSDGDTILTKADKTDVMLKLPTGVTSSKLKWLSVWCRQYSVNFGDVMFDKVILTATSSSEKPPNENLVSQPESRATKIACPILILTTSL